MSVAAFKPRLAALGWVSALRSLPHNPIPDYWLTADLRRELRKPWYLNGLFNLALLFSLLLLASSGRGRFAWSLRKLLKFNQTTFSRKW